MCNKIRNNLVFITFALVDGQPPKIIWLKMGNQSKAGTIKTLQDNHPAIMQASPTYRTTISTQWVKISNK